MKAISLAACIPLGCTSGGWNCYKHPASDLPRTQTSSRPTDTVCREPGQSGRGSLWRYLGRTSLGLTMSSSAALAGATYTLGSLLGTLNGSYLLGCPAAALTTFPLGAKAAAAVVGGALAVGAVPTVLGAVGFTGAGIAASSLAAKMMSAAAIANGGGVAAGSLVATFQSVGSAGLSLSSRVLLGSAGFALVSLVVGL
ncbi:interferon alpha-inducible protein 27, mitochondrial-like isoform X3 [Balaenoptera musculus]|uniref:Interferon alpha-inducible protein 27, mitochondrial-like isoform X3 n=1 Tax=Balaenoptera musculus TaxID=9771 RepID=A0A8B8WS37_BALMU|nr:interferon alpha-inducible protein 27, mitochondrial-like isoform X3 [Balaenoptera musculus]